MTGELLSSLNRIHQVFQLVRVACATDIHGSGRPAGRVDSGQVGTRFFCNINYGKSGQLGSDILEKGLHLFIGY